MGDSAPNAVIGASALTIRGVPPRRPFPAVPALPDCDTCARSADIGIPGKALPTIFDMLSQAVVARPRLEPDGPGEKDSGAGDVPVVVDAQDAEGWGWLRDVVNHGGTRTGGHG
jgi:hypothetical protein